MRGIVCPQWCWITRTVRLAVTQRVYFLTLLRSMALSDDSEKELNM